ncbi:hypothetical protein HYFRA_00000904 [Hymenoscyphus fraxineus]|uniref:Uncharacterized protein n=1 Tax=Hymenoscyphus fraxineus TaxID=746836 RepID=A0A9N9KQD7_9HELO|nr:hypothetical protein HYFRA_00000904 [Hymenoscyphus fraxineus]
MRKMFGSWTLGRSESLGGGETQGLTKGRHKTHEVETQTKILKLTAEALDDLKGNSMWPNLPGKMGLSSAKASRLNLIHARFMKVPMKVGGTAFSITNNTCVFCGKVSSQLITVKDAERHRGNCETTKVCARDNTSTDGYIPADMVIHRLTTPKFNIETFRHYRGGVRKAYPRNFFILEESSGDDDEESSKDESSGEETQYTQAEQKRIRIALRKRFPNSMLVLDFDSEDDDDSDYDDDVPETDLTPPPCS